MLFRSILVASCCATLVFGISIASAQKVTSSNTTSIPSNNANNDPFTGGTRITHTITTGMGKNVRDFHICVAITKLNRGGKGRVIKKGDPINGNYRLTPATGTPAGWTYRGLRQNPTRVPGEARWCITWVRSSPAPDNATSSFSFDYKGQKNIGSIGGRAVLTNNGNDNSLDGQISTNPGLVPVSFTLPDDAVFDDQDLLAQDVTIQPAPGTTERLIKLTDVLIQDRPQGGRTADPSSPPVQGFLLQPVPAPTTGQAQ